jgi:hypothetical protein
MALMALGGVDMFPSIGRAAFLQGRIGQTLFTVREKRNDA